MISIVTQIQAALQGFAADDPGRSVAFSGVVPSVEILSVRGDVPLPAASVMKIPLAMAIFQMADSGEIDLDERVPVEMFSSTRYCSILKAFDSVSTLTLREVCRMMLITSDNPLAAYLQERVPFQRVNALLQTIGCDPDKTRMEVGFGEMYLGPLNRANTLTALDALKILDEIDRNSIYSDLNLALANNLRNNRIPADLPETVVIAHKTGGLDGVANDIGIVSERELKFKISFLSDRQKPNTIKASADMARCAALVYKVMKSDLP